MKKFSSYKIGDNAEISRTVTKSDLYKFVELTGDDNKLHISEELASTTTLKKTVVHIFKVRLNIM